MAVDKREMILLRLMELLGTITGLIGVHRDRGGVPPVDSETKEDMLPCAILLDGKENIGIRTAGKAMLAGMPPTTMILEPQIYVLLKPRDTPENEGIGEELSAFRVKVLKAVSTDQTLIALLGSNGDLEYRGCETDMQAGALLEGQIRLDFALTYTFNPAQL